MTTNLKLAHRLMYYIIIGATSALIHVLTVFNLVFYLQFQPLIANIFAFFIAFNISYLGHKYVTFAKLKDQKQLSLPHFFVVASSAAILNEALYFLLLNDTSLNYLVALVLVLGVVSIYSFIISKFWACR